MSANTKIINWLYIIGTVLSMGALFFLSSGLTNAANTPNRSVTLSTTTASTANVTYTFRFDIVGSYSLGSIVLEICEEDPLPGEPCTAPVGFDSTAGALTNQIGETGFTIDPTSTNERILLTRPAQVTTTTEYEFSNFTNPSANGTYFARIYTYPTSDATGLSTDIGGLAFAITNAITYQAEVPPFLFFCSGVSIPGLTCAGGTSGQFIGFGEFGENYTATATSQFMVATNARSGYNVSMYGNSLTSGSNIISPITAVTGSVVGRSQFGINLRDNSNPNVGQDPAGIGAGYVANDYNIVNNYKFLNGDVIAKSDGTSDHTKFTVSYIVNVSDTQKPGVYSTTLIYLCLANF
jgi:hypothetical protein